MDAALAEARAALAEGEVPVGCAVVDGGGAVLAVGRNATHRSGDAAAHAEVVALRALARADRAPAPAARSLTLFVTCEPCVMCAGAVLHSRLFRAVVFGCANPRFGGCGSVRALAAHAAPAVDGKTPEPLPAVTAGVRAAECVALLEQFYQTANPYAPAPRAPRKRERGGAGSAPPERGEASTARPRGAGALAAAAPGRGAALAGHERHES